ncbi:glycosyltransferase family 2 protein [Hirschia baltica]|uniref:Glycosyl transferase family 2 n=1 Tax=Hirschia baltica (strain ATCC 49814 / DSM 5838 / IFAM 1418) TaxID=582402 RepID=C6XLW7_HIRBI|nr:glycosyltransferase family 2 protein [Hirschia baltica]ACT59799.1 glycosyl transferase family 2 [Hirschia baltica ATCC 49814]
MTYSQDLAQQIVAVIPTLNEENYIEECLKSLMIGDTLLREVQFIVVDGGSTDNTVQIVETLMQEFPNLSYLHNEKKLQSAALNLAAENAAVSCTIMVRCDAHSIYPENFVLKTAAKLKEIGAASVVVPMDAVGTTGFQEANAWVVDKPFGSGGSAHRGGTGSGYVDHGHHAAFDLAIFKEIGGYDENFSHNEDAEYDYRVTQAGYKIYMDAESRIKYMPRPTFRGVWKQYFKYGRGRAMNMKKHGSAPKLRQAIPIINLALMFGSAALFVLLALTGLLKAMPFLAVFTLAPLAYLGALFIVGCMGIKSLKKVSGFNAAFALGAMHNSWALGFIKGYFFVPTSK